MKILVLNSGSSSQKARFYDLKPPPPDDPPEPQWDGKLEWRDDRATFEIRTSSGAISKEGAKKSDRSSATAQLLGELASAEASPTSCSTPAPRCASCPAWSTWLHYDGLQPRKLPGWVGSFRPPSGVGTGNFVPMKTRSLPFP